MIETIATYAAPVATIIAAIMTAANLGTRVTGWGFMVFSVGAVAWVVQGLATGQRNLVIANGALLAIDLIGVWRWLGRQSRYDDAAEGAHRKSARTEAPTLFALGSLQGTPVRTASGTTLGSAVETMASCSDGQIAYVVVSQGGVGGVGETLHAIGWDEVRYREDALVTELDGHRLTARPVLNPERWPATAEAAGVG